MVILQCCKTLVRQPPRTSGPCAFCFHRQVVGQGNYLISLTSNWPSRRWPSSDKAITLVGSCQIDEFFLACLLEIELMSLFAIILC